MTIERKAEAVKAWNQANPERKLELTRRGNRALYWRQKALADICKSVAATPTDGGI